jgi:hypothetical protein
MIDEYLHYVATPGERDALLHRFTSKTLTLFAKHGITVTGFWLARDQPDTLTYLCRFSDDAARQAAWNAFNADPDWAALKAETERAGPLVASRSTVVLTPVPGAVTA